MNRPEFLYKYHSAKRAIQILKNLQFYFAPVSQLNDLYEFRINAQYSLTEESKIKLHAKNLIFHGAFDKMDEAIDFIKEYHQKDQIEETSKFIIDGLNRQIKNISEHSGVTCFSELKNNQRMWGTYGDNHTGVVIEFKTISDSSKIADHFMPVFYIQSKLSICPSEFLREDMTIDSWICSALCCFKHYDWNEEKEWRLILLADSEQQTSDRLIQFERNAISRIFLGPKISIEDENEVRHIANIIVPNIPVLKRKVDEFEAQEHLEGMEVIHSFDQLKYWTNKPN